MDHGGSVVMVGRAEIDTRAPFKSVKEAVALFGERVLAGELLFHAPRDANTADQLHRVMTAPRPVVHHQAVTISPAVAMVAAPPPPRRMPAPPATRELDDAKHELEKEREEKHKMAGCIQSLQQELSSAMRELQKLKARDEDARAKVIEVEDLKFMETDEPQQQRHQQHHHQSPPASGQEAMAASRAAAAAEFQKKRYVTFADPPAAAYDRAPSPPRDVVLELHRHHQQPHYAPAAGRPQYREARFQRQVSAGPGHEAVKKAMAAAAEEEEGRKKKKKPLIPLVGALFMRKKKSSATTASSHRADDGSSAVKPRPSF
ncbi:hypothetical protein ACQJBY_014363 [Aegilops geniculata]